MIRREKRKEEARVLEDGQLLTYFQKYFKYLKLFNKYKQKGEYTKTRKFAKKFQNLEETITKSLSKPIIQSDDTRLLHLIQRLRLSFSDLKVFLYIYLQEKDNRDNLCNIESCYDDDFDLDEECTRGIKITEITKLFSLTKEEIEQIFFSPQSRLINRKIIEVHPPNDQIFIDRSDYIAAISKAFKKGFTIEETHNSDFRLIEPYRKGVFHTDIKNLLEEDTLAKINSFIEEIRSTDEILKKDTEATISYPILLIYGERRREKEIISESIAKELELPLLKVENSNETDDDDFFVSAYFPLEENLSKAFDFARIHNAIVVIKIEKEDDLSALNRYISKSSITKQCPVIIIKSGNLKTDTLGYDYIRLLYRDIKLEQPPPEIRVKLWIHTFPLSRFRIDNLVFGELASKYEHFALEEIETTISRLKTDSTISKKEDIRYEDITKVADEVERIRLAKETDEDDMEISDITLSSCTEKISDVVLNDNEYSEVNRIITAIRNRDRLYNEILRGHINYGKGIKTFFYGPPGTGKTLTIRAIAGELNLPLIEVMLSKLFNPFVGITEKMISQYFREATSKKAILFFDECDPLIMSRNMLFRSWEFSVINTFLKEIERFGGVLFLATNYETIRDEALNRRIQFMVKFDIPTREKRKLLLGLLGDSFSKNLDIERIIDIPFNGGDLKNVRLRLAIETLENNIITTDRIVEELTKEVEKRNHDSQSRCGF